MAEDKIELPDDLGRAFQKTMKEAGLKDVPALTRALGSAVDQTSMFNEVLIKVVENMKHTDKYTQKSIVDLTKVNQILGIKLKMSINEVRASNEIINLAKTNYEINKDLDSILESELQARREMVLIQTMLKTGLEGEYATMAATLLLQGNSVELEKAQLSKLAEKEKLLSEERDLRKEMSSMAMESESDKLHFKFLGEKINQKKYEISLKQKEVDLSAKAITDGKTAYAGQIAMLKNRQEQNKVIVKQNELIKATADATLRLKEESEAYKKAAMGHIATFQALLKQPQLIAGMAIAAVGKMGDAFSETYKSMKEEGLSSGQAFTATMHSYGTSIMSLGTVSAKSVQEASKAIQETGGTLHDAEEAAEGAAKMARDFGGSAANAGKAIGNLSKLPGMTKQAAENAALFGAHLAVAANVPADTVTKAIANNMDAAAMAGPKMQKSFALAAINAEKIGVEFSVITGTQKSLLNFEDSINKQMEASVLLGREINLDKARELALAGDLEGMQREILKVVGSEAEFNKMNVLQKEALAASMGVSVGDMAKMVKGQGELTELGKEGLAANAENASWYEVAGNFLMENAGAAINFAATVAAGIVQLMTLNATKALTTTLTGANTTATIAGTAATTVNTGVVGANTVAVGTAGTTASTAAIGMLAFAAAAIATGVAVYLVFTGLTGLAEAMKGMSGEALIALVAVVVAVGFGMYFMSGAITAVSAASVAGAVGMGIFALVLLSVGASVLMIGAGIALATNGMTGLVTAMGKSKDMVAPFIALAAVLVPLVMGLYAMAGATTVLSAAAVPLMPFLLGLLAVAAVVPMLSNMFGSVGEAKDKNDESKEDPIGPVLKDIKTALTKMNTYLAAPMEVRMDSTKVGEALKKGLAR